ncbi:hypothetical protein KIW84_074988 [Lathyrus oleraceus]|uniref:Retrotransposon gag domain-containing protein n=1 Tax=Pisum sativum TaxID=3888 RepID=A0A9D4VSM1_PEA|nr:hypothetical protein KIW84_074988 [Pisum sativum]
MLAGFPWGMPPNFVPKGFARTLVTMPESSPVMCVPSPVVHTLSRVKDTIYHSEPSEGPYIYEKMDDMKDQFHELRKELKTLRGKDLFGKSVVELCLVPNVKIPMKFKVPDFEKYNGNTCSLRHLVIYTRKMSTQTDNDQLLIHYFQDSLTSVALRWYMELKNASVRTFNDLGEAFIKQYKYILIWRLIETRCLSKEEASSSKKYGSGSSKRKEAETNSVSVGRQRRHRVRRSSQPRQHQHHVSSVIPVFSNNSNNQSVPILQQQQQRQQQPQQITNFNNNNNNNNQQQNFERKKVSFDPTPMSYAKLYPSLVLKNLIQPRNPPQIPEPLPWWFKPELHRAFHQGAPGHDIENCYLLKYEVQKLVKSGMTSFEDCAPNVTANSLPAHVQCHNGGKWSRGSFSYNEYVVNKAYIAKVTRSGRVFGPVFPKEVEDVSASKKMGVPVVNLVSAPLLQTPSKISVMSLLMNYEAHREALQKVLEQAYVEHDVTVDPIMDNITSCNNMSFCDEELPEEGRNHNLALHISMNCKEDALSNVLVDTGSSLNVLPKSTLSRHSYQGAPMRYSGMIVKAFDGSRKTVVGEVDVLVKIGPSDFHITFQKLKFLKNGKLVVVCAEKALLVSHLSSFSYVEAEEEVETSFQALSIVEVNKNGAPMSSFKDAQISIETGNTN